MIKQYNKHMGGVDRCDQNISLYRIGVKSRKWWWPLFIWIPDMIMQNCWLFYSGHAKECRHTGNAGDLVIAGCAGGCGRVLTQASSSRSHRRTTRHAHCLLVFTVAVGLV